MESIILAGGLGTRLRSVVSNLPKAMAPIRGKPFLEYVLNYLKRNHVERVVLSVGYKWRDIQSYFGNTFSGLDLVYCVEERPLGTGGGLKRALEYASKQHVFVLNGDTLFDVPLFQLTERTSPDCKLVLALKKHRESDRYGTVEIDGNGIITAFKEKNTGQGERFINAGVYLISRNIFDNFILPEKFSLESFIEDKFEMLRACAVIMDGFFIDIGVPEDYVRAQSQLKELI